jgi:hypothetical protein
VDVQGLGGPVRARAGLLPRRAATLNRAKVPWVSVLVAYLLANVALPLHVLATDRAARSAWGRGGHQGRPGRLPGGLAGGGWRAGGDSVVFRRNAVLWSAVSGGFSTALRLITALSSALPVRVLLTMRD